MSIFGVPQLDGLATSLGSIWQNYQNQKLADKTNAQQAELLAQQNEYNSAEAEKQRQWEERMSNTAYQRARSDMEAAGINPILLGGSASEASTPTGYAASSSASHGQHVPNMVNFIQTGMNSAQASERNDIEMMKTILHGISSLGSGS